LGDCLKALEVAALEVDYNLILVDDKSPEPAELDVLYNSLDGRAQVIRHPQNVGFPATCNDGAARGTSPAILFLNSDVMLQPGAVKAMLKTLWSDDLPQSMIAPHEGPAGVVGPRLLFP